MGFETQLKDEIAYQLKELHTTPTGTDEYKITVDGVTKLMDRAIEMDKIEKELTNKNEERYDADEFKERQLKTESIDKMVRNGIALFGIFVNVGLAVWGTKTSLKFEETGTLTTDAGKSFIRLLFPKK
mgnify:CR=1 FL=1